MTMDFAGAVRLFKALGDENRMQILTLLHDGDKCGCRLLEALDISQPTLSHHMKILCDAGLVSARREGKWMYYSICCQAVAEIRYLLQTLLDPTRVPLDCRCRQAGTASDNMEQSKEETE